MIVVFFVKDYVVEPLGIAYLSSFLKNHGFKTLLIKTHNMDRVTLRNAVRQAVKGENQVVLCYSVTTGSQNYYLMINRWLKEDFRQAVSIFGGSHPTYFPEIIDEEGVDCVIRGEGEYSLLNVLRDISKGNQVERVVGVLPLVEDLDTLPFPDRELLYRYKENRNNLIKNVITSRGCPFSCPYCYNVLLKKIYKGQRYVRYRSPRNVIDECKELKKYPLKLIFFEDDEFIVNKPRLHELLDMYEKEVGVPFHCQIRIEYLSYRIARHLKEAGCTGVTFAIENGNEGIRKWLLDRKVSNKQVLEGCRILKEVGLKYRSQNMCCLPDETWKNAMETVDLNIKCRPTIGWMSIFQPYPDLPLGEYARKLGLWDGKIDQFSPSFFERTVLKRSDAKKFNNLQKLFSVVVQFPFLRWFLNLLVEVPENGFYNFIYKWHKKCLYRKLYKVA